MHIAFLILSLDGGGAERTATALSSHMAEKGHTVTLIALTGTKCFYPVSEKVDIQFLNLSPLPTTPKAERIIAMLRRAVALRKTICALNPDVLVGMSHIMSAYAVFCTKGTHIKAIGTERANPYVLQAGKAITLLRKCSFILCDGFVTQTQKAKAFFPKISQHKAVVIPNAVFNPLVNQVRIPKQRNNSITALGRLDYNKGYDILIRAFKEIAEDFPEYNLVIYGEGKNRIDFEKLTKELNIQAKVQFPGASPDAILKVAESSLFVLSSRSEGMPNALIEALACGVPCVSTSCDMGPEELIENGKNGILVSVEDVQAMASAMRSILKDRSFANSLSANATEIRNTHSIATITDIWLDYFQHIINRIPLNTK